jgi:predicted amidohydrolase YtcJ
VALDGDPLTCEVDRIRALSVELTICDGRIVHERQRAKI